MSDNFQKIIDITSDETIHLADSFKSLLHKELVLGQTRWVCRHGTLSDGHEKITPSQRYYQAIKEMWFLSQNMRSQRVIAMKSQADLLDAQESLQKAEKQSDKLRAEANVLLAEQQILTALVTLEDQARMLDEYNKIRLELQDQVRQVYPHGIEQSEPDNWQAVFRYRMLKRTNEIVSNIPLDPETKATLGLEYQRPDAMAPLMIGQPEKACALINKNAVPMIRNHNNG